MGAYLFYIDSLGGGGGGGKIIYTKERGGQIPLMKKVLDPTYEKSASMPPIENKKLLVYYYWDSKG